MSPKCSNGPHVISKIAQNAPPPPPICPFFGRFESYKKCSILRLFRQIWQSLVNVWVSPYQPINQLPELSVESSSMRKQGSATPHPPLHVPFLHFSFLLALLRPFLLYSVATFPFIFWLARPLLALAFDLRLEVAGSIPAAALSSATWDKLFIVQRLWCYNLMALYKSV